MTTTAIDTDIYHLDGSTDQTAEQPTSDTYWVPLGTIEACDRDEAIMLAQDRARLDGRPIMLSHTASFWNVWLTATGEIYTPFDEAAQEVLS